MKELTLVIVNHNNSRWLDECFSSINRQSLTEFLIIFIDDASTDDSREKFLAYPWRNGISAKLVPLEENHGVSKARIAGMQQVSTPFVTNLDSDDFYISPRKLEAELTLAKSHDNAIGFSEIILVDAEGSPKQGTYSPPIHQGNLLTHILSRSCMIPRDFVMPMELYQRSGGYDPEINLYEDWDLKLRLAKISQFIYTGIQGTAYRRHGSGLSSVPPYRHKEAQSRILLKNINIYKQLIGIDALEKISQQLGITKPPAKDSNRA